jgi:hypothetical protein
MAGAEVRGDLNIVYTMRRATVAGLGLVGGTVGSSLDAMPALSARISDSKETVNARWRCQTRSLDRNRAEECLDLRPGEAYIFCGHFQG